MLKGALGLLWDIDLALFQPLNQIVRRQIDQLDRIRAIEHRIRHRLAHPDMRNLRDHVVEALDVLNIDRSVDVDAVREQFLNVEIALRMPAAGRIGVGEFIDQRDLRMARDDSIEIHLPENLVFVFEPFVREDLKALQQRFVLRPSMGLDHAAYGEVWGSRALDHVVTRSIGTGMKGFSVCNVSTSSLAPSFRALMVGPRLDPPELAAL